MPGNFAPTPAWRPRNAQGGMRFAFPPYSYGALKGKPGASGHLFILPHASSRILGGEGREMESLLCPATGGPLWLSPRPVVLAGSRFLLKADS